MRYIEMHRGPAAYVLGPPLSTGGDVEQGGCGSLVSEGLEFLVKNVVIEHSLERFRASMPSNRVSYT